MILILLSIVGVIAICGSLLDSLWSPLEQISSYLIPCFLPSKEEPLTKKFGTWAAVTGGTDGIGKEYAMELARRGCNVVIISRNIDKLKAVAEEIEKQHKVKTKVIQADFSTGPAVYAAIEEGLKDIPLGILVNNVGLNVDYPKPVCEMSQSNVWELINVNVGAVTTMSRLVLPGMVARGKGAIVNVSSGTELQPMPLTTVYGASKAYMRSFTLALREEYASKGIFIQHLSPMIVATKINAFSKRIADGNLLIPDAATYSRHAVRSLGRVHNTTGYWWHGIQYTIYKMTPVWIGAKIGLKIHNQFRREYEQNKMRAEENTRHSANIGC